MNSLLPKQQKALFFPFSLIPIGVTSRSCRSAAVAVFHSVWGSCLLLTRVDAREKKKGLEHPQSWFSYLTLVKQTRAGLPTFFFLLFFHSLEGLLSSQRRRRFPFAAVKKKKKKKKISFSTLAGGGSCLCALHV